MCKSIAKMDERHSRNITQLFSVIKQLDQYGFTHTHNEGISTNQLNFLYENTFI